MQLLGAEWVGMFYNPCRDGLSCSTLRAIPSHTEALNSPGVYERGRAKGNHAPLTTARLLLQSGVRSWTRVHGVDNVHA